MVVICHPSGEGKKGVQGRVTCLHTEKKISGAVDSCKSGGRGSNSYMTMCLRTINGSLAGSDDEAGGWIESGERAFLSGLHIQEEKRRGTGGREHVTPFHKSGSNRGTGKEDNRKPWKNGGVGKLLQNPLKRESVGEGKTRRSPERDYRNQNGREEGKSPLHGEGKFQ